MPILGLVDCNSFYASCEKVFRPGLATRPVVVLSNNDGCVVARSPEAKTLGIGMGVPFFKVRDLCRQRGVAVFSSNYTLYGDMSRRVMTALAHWSPKIEIYSIDEAFLDLSGIDGADTEAFGERLTSTVRRWTGIPVSIGVAPTKTLAKIANRAAKSSGKGVHRLLTKPEQEACLQPLPVEEIWGISEKLGTRLRMCGITTAAQLRDADLRFLRNTFSITMERTARELNGEMCLPPDEAPPAKQSITVSRSFGDLLTELPDLEEAVATFAARAGEKLRAQGSVAGGIHTYIRTNQFRRDDPQYTNACSIGFPHPSNHTNELIAAALEGLRAIYRPKHLYKKAGVILLDLQRQETVDAQGSLFAPPDARKRGDALMAVMDHLNREMGRDTVVFGSQRVEGAWAMRREWQGSRFTTNWEELPVVLAK